MRLFGKVDGVRDRFDRPFTFRGLPFTIAWEEVFVEPPEATGATFRSIFTSAPRLGLTVYEYPGGPLVGDWTRAQGVVVETGQHGFGVLTGFLPATDLESFYMYRAERPFHIVLSDGLHTAYEGRIEDVSIGPRGFSFTAFGYWRALSDIPFTGLFIDDRVSAWFTLTPDELAESLPDRFAMDTNNRLYFAPTTGSAFSSTAAWGVMGYAIPDGSEEQIVEVTFTYTLVGSASWRARLDRRDASWGFLSTEWTLDGDGGTQTGTVTETFTASDRITFSFFFNAASATYSGETGDVYLRITSIKVKAVSGTVTAQTIAQALVEFVSGLNPTQLSSSVAGISDPGLALETEVYEDAFPADLLTGLGALGDSATPPQRYTAAVWEKRLLRFEPEGSVSRTWYVDVIDFQVERSMDSVANEAYGVYRGSHGTTERTAVEGDAAAIGRHGFRRREAVRVETGSAAVAENIRDLALAEKATAKPRAKIITRGVVDASGVPQPLYSVRAGDVIVLRNLPANTFGGIDEVRSFRLAATRYDCDADELIPTPADALMTLDIIVARRDRSL